MQAFFIKYCYWAIQGNVGPHHAWGPCSGSLKLFGGVHIKAGPTLILIFGISGESLGWDFTRGSIVPN